MVNIKELAKSKKFIVILAAVVVFLAGVFGFYLSGIGAAEPGSEEEVVITVESGQGALSVLEELDEAGLVKNKFCGKILVKLSRINSIHANTYIFTKDMTLTEIFVAMKTGDHDYISGSKVTIIEGATIPQVVEAVSSATGISQEEILAVWNDPAYLKELIGEYWFLTDEILAQGILYPLEGYLYPETYFTGPMEDASDVKTFTKRILDKTAAELEPYREQIESSEWTVHKLITFASVVERESLFEEDRAMIAGVFKNRLDIGMAMQSDITVLYAIGKSHVDVSIAETQVDSPYNTYKYPGLPIGPVCAVPVTTIDSCMNYEEHDYFFFFATEDGDVIYTETNDDHNEVVSENKWY